MAIHTEIGATRGSLNLESGVSPHETIFQDHSNPIGAVCHHHSCRMVILRIREQPSHEAVHQLVPTRNSNRATITAACWNRKRPRPSPPPYLAVLDLSSEHDPDASPPLHVHHLPSESHRWP